MIPGCSMSCCRVYSPWLQWLQWLGPLVEEYTSWREIDINTRGCHLHRTGTIFSKKEILPWVILTNTCPVPNPMMAAPTSANPSTSGPGYHTNGNEGNKSCSNLQDSQVLHVHSPAFVPHLLTMEMRALNPATTYRIARYCMFIEQHLLDIC